MTASRKNYKPARMFCLWLNDGHGWLLKSVQETAMKATAARDWYLQRGCRPDNLRITQDNPDGSENRPT